MYQRQFRNSRKNVLINARKKVGLAIPVLAWLLVGISTQGLPLSDVTSKLDWLSDLLQNHQITRLEILHVRDNILFRSRVTPDMLRKIAKNKVVVSDPWESGSFKELLTSLQEIRNAKPREPAEVRWAVLFFDATGREISAVYFSSDGSFAIFQGASLSVRGRLVNWAKAFIRSEFLR